MWKSQDQVTISNSHLNTKWSTSGREFKRPNHFRTAISPPGPFIICPGHTSKTVLSHSLPERNRSAQPPCWGLAKMIISIPSYQMEALGFVSLRNGELLEITKFSWNSETFSRQPDFYHIIISTSESRRRRKYLGFPITLLLSDRQFFTTVDASVTQSLSWKRPSRVSNIPVGKIRSCRTLPREI